MKDEATCHDSRQNQWNAWDNPKSEGWDTEVFHGQAKKQLKQLAKLMASAGRPLEAKPFRGLVTATMTTEPLVPASPRGRLRGTTIEGPQRNSGSYSGKQRNPATPGQRFGRAGNGLKSAT